MARLVAADNASFLELVPVPTARGRDESLSLRVAFEAWGEPVEGVAAMTREGAARLVERIRQFCARQAGMLQLRNEEQTLELNLAAKRSKWTSKLRVTGLSNVPETADPNLPEETRVSLGITYRQEGSHNGAPASVEHRAGMVCTFEALDRFATELAAETTAA